MTYLLALSWVLYIGPPGNIVYIDEYPTEQVCEIVGSYKTDQNHASWVHCFEDPLPAIMELIENETRRKATGGR